MIRATAISLVDQAMLSAANFLLAIVLIRFASQEEYGLYTQLIGLQALFSVLHAGLFVSAFMATSPRLQGQVRREYQTAMARAEIATTLASALLVLAITWVASRWLRHSLMWTTSAAAALAVLGLWWREFARARYYSESRAFSVLRLDVLYVGVLSLGVVALWWERSVSATAVLWLMGAASAGAALSPLFRQARQTKVSDAARGRVRESWRSARWEILISLITWGHAQTFVYFAALQGGLTAAAEISAARLITMPLALVWLSYANILRPEASRLLQGGESRAQLDRLALRSAGFVLVLAVGYGALLMVAAPLMERHVFAQSFQHLGAMSLLWVLYFALTGMTTIATSVLRSAFEFKALFRVHAICGALAVSLFVAGLWFSTATVFVIILVGVEAILATFCWRLLRAKLRGAEQALDLRRAQEA